MPKKAATHEAIEDDSPPKRMRPDEGTLAEVRRMDTALHAYSSVLNLFMALETNEEKIAHLTESIEAQTYALRILMKDEMENVESRKALFKAIETLKKMHVDLSRRKRFRSSIGTQLDLATMAASTLTASHMTQPDSANPVFMSKVDVDFSSYDFTAKDFTVSNQLITGTLEKSEAEKVEYDVEKFMKVVHKMGEFLKAGSDVLPKEEPMDEQPVEAATDDI
jgi:hypothetical protein